MNTVPELSSLAMPNPSALFCLSNAFRSRTLEIRKPHAHTKGFRKPFCPLSSISISELMGLIKKMFQQSLTYMTAWVQPCSERSRHLASLSGNPAFSIAPKTRSDKWRSISSDADMVNLKYMFHNRRHCRWVSVSRLYDQETQNRKVICSE